MCINIICAVDVDKKILLFVRFGLNYIDIVFGSVRELYYLLLFDIVSFPICIFVFVWSEKRPQNIVWSVLVTKKSTFAQAWMCAMTLPILSFLIIQVAALHWIYLYTSGVRCGNMHFFINNCSNMSWRKSCVL